MTLCRIFTTLFLFFILSAANAHALSIDAVRIGTHPDKTRVVFDLSEMADFRVFALDGPYRIVVDMPQVGWDAGMPALNPKDGITNIRYGALKPGVSRIVFDLGGPVKIRSAFMLPGSSDKPNRLVVDFNAVNDAVFQQSKAEIYGTLTIDESVTTASYHAQTTPSAGQPPAAPPPKPKTIKKPLIVIDPGHGGNDPGAVGKGKIYEKNVVLKLAKDLKHELENSGQYRVLLTRETDIYIKLHERIKFARRHEADLFISIHADSIDKPGVRGASVYTLSEKASDKQSAQLAERENRSDLIAGVDLSHEDEDVAGILFDLVRRDTMNQSKFFAEKIVASYEHGNMRLLENPHRHAGFAVLKATDIPAVLVEAGFMSNRQEVELLSSSAERKKIAKTLHKGIDHYFEQVRKNQKD